MTNYNNPYYEDNVYGHVVSLLRSLAPTANGVHLDIGCGFGHIAQAIQSELGMDYIGVDIHVQGLESLKERGFEAEYADLRDIVGTEKIIREALGGRSISSISMIDTLEHLEQPATVLGMLARLSKEFSAPFVCSVPNATHRDIGAKLVLGRWDLTREGLLDFTHLHFFSEKSLTGLLRENGFLQVDAKDVAMVKSDQHFPETHPLLSRSTVLGKVVGELRDGAPHAHTYQFVRAYLQGPPLARDVPDHLSRPVKAPFLSVITRTQGRRLDTLREVLLCLSAQTDDDFEVLVVGHRLDPEARLAVERVIEDVNEGLRDRIRLIRIEHGNRTAPLNFGFASASGSYIAILDDDDLVFANWVETFHDLAKAAPGRVLRSVAVAQMFTRVGPDGESSVMAVGSPDKRFPDHFDHLAHLYENVTPPVALAFPAVAFNDAGIRFDENLTTTEDWDFLMRTVNVCGISCSPEITCIYRQWYNAESSFTVHSKSEWVENHYYIWKKFDNAPLMLDAGATAKIRAMQSELEQRRKGEPVPDSADEFSLPAPELARELEGLRHEVHRYFNSRSWRCTAPFRWIAVRLGGSEIPEPPLWTLNREDLYYLIHRITNTRSWRMTARLRRMH